MGPCQQQWLTLELVPLTLRRACAGCVCCAGAACTHRAPDLPSLRHTTRTTQANTTHNTSTEARQPACQSASRHPRPQRPHRPKSRSASAARFGKRRSSPAIERRKACCRVASRAGRARPPPPADPALALACPPGFSHRRVLPRSTPVFGQERGEVGGHHGEDVRTRRPTASSTGRRR